MRVWKARCGTGETCSDTIVDHMIPFLAIACTRAHTYMYKCIYIYVYTCMHKWDIHTFACTNILVHLHAHACTHTHIHRMHTYKHISTTWDIINYGWWEMIFVSSSICMCISIHPPIDTYTHTHTHKYMHTHNSAILNVLVVVVNNDKCVEIYL